MHERLITAGQGSKTPLVVIVVAIVLLGLLASRIPWSIAHPDAALTYFSEEAKTVFLYFGAAVAVAFIAALAVQVLIGLGALASVYGCSGASGASIATPWGVIGHWRQRLRLRPGVVTIHLVDGARPSRVHRYGVQHVYFTQGGRTLHTMSSVRYGPGCRARLVEWLERFGVTPVFEGDDRVLPN